MHEIDSGFNHVLLKDGYPLRLVCETIGFLLQFEIAVGRLSVRLSSGTLAKSILAVREDRDEATSPLGGADAWRERIVGEHALDDIAGGVSIAGDAGHTAEKRPRL